MSKKINRKMGQLIGSQKEAENNSNKFEATKDLAQEKKVTQSPTGRISPQISCTVLPEDREMLNELTMYAINKVGKPLNTSSIIRALIRLGHKKKEELEF